jgi:hypothetical protein
MANKRVFYAAKRVGLGPVGSAGGGGDFTQVHGVQSVGMTTTFNLEQTFELGQLAIYENIEGIPDVSIDIEKVLDGYCPVYVLATSTSLITEAATSPSILGRSKSRCDFTLGIYKDDDADGIAGGTAVSTDAESHVMCSGVFVNSVSYNVGSEGYATETVTLVGQDKVWFGHSNFNGAAATFGAGDFIASEDQPYALTIPNSGGVNRREDVLFDYDALGQYPTSGTGTVLPTEIPGITPVTGKNEKDVDGNFNCHVSSFTANVDLAREDIFELGRRGRYFRFVPFPTEVTCDITITSVSGDLISHTEEGLVDPEHGNNLTDQTIRLHMREGLVVDLGKKNKLASVSVTGGDAGGGNEEITYSYTNFNDFTVYHPRDPKAATSAAFRPAGTVWDIVGD